MEKELSKKRSCEDLIRRYENLQAVTKIAPKINDNSGNRMSRRFSGESLHENGHATFRTVAHDTNEIGDQSQMKAIMQALDEKSFELAERLISNAPQLKVFRDQAGKSAMMYPQTLATIRQLVTKSSKDEVNAEDKNGQSVLMWALQQNDEDVQCKIAKYLIDHGANIDHKDNAERSSLTYAVWKNRLPIVKILVGKGVDPNGIDARKRNALHHLTADITRAQHGSDEVGEQVLEQLLKANANPNARDWNGHTCFYSALRSGNVWLAEALLRRTQIEVNAETKAGWSMLHAACEQPLASVELVRSLIDMGCDANQKIPRSEKTPLHLAAHAGNLEVVEYLLQRPEIDRNAYDSFGNSPLFCASLRDSEKRRAIGKLFAPWHPSNIIAKQQDPNFDHIQAAAEQWEATVVDFDISNPAGSSVKQYRIYDLIERPHRKFPGDPHFSTVMSDCAPGSFRWIHLPANNTSWCRDLILKCFIETGCKDVYGFRNIERSLNHQHCGQSKHLHSRYMNPLCVPVFASASSKDKLEQFAPIPAAVQHTCCKGCMQERVVGKNDEECDFDATINHLIMFMPYLHYETYSDMCAMETKVEEALMGDPCADDATAETSLLRAYLSTGNQTLHMRRTLDQFFYHNIDTKIRNRNQVIHRHQKKDKASVKEDHKILMVDQLWMWVIEKDLVITSFPRVRTNPSHDPMDILEIIKEMIRTNIEDPIDNVYELASLIVSHVGGAQDGQGYGRDALQVLNIFESEVGAAMDVEVKLFHAFQDDANRAADWLSKATSSERKAQETKPEDDIWEEPKDPEVVEVRQSFFGSLLDISTETNLLKEVKDIRDELGMLKLLFTIQKQVVPGFQKALKSVSRKQTQWKRLAQHVENIPDEQKRLYEHPLEHINSMDDQAKLIYQSIRDLLELKQKHVNAIEAHYSRFQAESTAQQGKTLLVFTIVTVIFLPLSFIAAVMTINIAEFPRNEAGFLALPWVAEYVFGVGIPIAIICVLAALLVGPLKNRVDPLYKRAMKGFGLDEPAPPPRNPPIPRSKTFVIQPTASAIVAPPPYDPRRPGTAVIQPPTISFRSPSRQNTERNSGTVIKPPGISIAPPMRRGSNGDIRDLWAPPSPGPNLRIPRRPTILDLERGPM
jgi:ankyrin repeat protein/Mg2+ and Co2+ transporter CorA